MRLRSKVPFVIVSFLFVTNACKTAPHQEKPVDQQAFIDRYIKAKAASSCDDFQSLSREQSFALHELAKLRAQEACAKDPIDFAAYTSWLKPAAADAAISLAQKQNDLQRLVPLCIEKSKQPLTHEERLQWANLAESTAEKLNDQTLIDQSKQRIYLISPRLKPEPTEKEYLTVADDFRYHREFSQAQEYYEKVIDNNAASVPEKISAFKGLRLSFKNARDNKNFLATNTRLIKFLEKKLRRQRKGSRLLFRQMNDAMVMQARALWTQGHVKDALKAASSFERELKGRYSLMDIYWLRARMAEEKGDLDNSNKFLDMALAQVSGGDLETRDKLRWVMAWNKRREKNYETASDLFQKLMEQTQNESTRYRAEFWLAKVKSEMGHEEEAKSNWETLTGDDPLGYYGLLAYYQLQKPILQSKKQAEAAVPAAAQKGVQNILHPEIADSLIQVQETDVLQTYLDEIARRYKKNKSQNDVVWVRLLKYYARAGLYLKLYENLNQISPDQRNAILQNNPELLFPRPFEAEVRQAASELQVEPELIYSIMRQESAFNSKARSAADAFGLMQVIPEVANQLSKKYSIPLEKNEDLYDPAVNVKIGAALLKDQLRRYHDQFILAVASYNANDQAIQNWMSSRFHGDAIEFIEDIPYEETRGYVRLVMRNLVFYRLLVSKDQTMAFPQWVLQLTSAGP